MITTDGIYSIPIDLYHSQACCDGPSISKSELVTMLDCPAKYGHAKRSQALDLGRAAHHLALGEPDFAEHYVIAPFDDFRTKDARGWRDAQTKTVLKAEEFATVQAMAAAILAHPYAKSAFLAGDGERSIIVKDKGTGIWLKSRPDWLPTSPAAFVKEYKTAVSAHPQKFATDCFGFGYDIQAAIALDNLKAVTGDDYPGFALVVQEKTEPYVTELYVFTAEQIAHGRARYRRALDIFARCLETSQWPSYNAEPTMLPTPRWLQLEGQS